jgi:hypothetical protein
MEYNLFPRLSQRADNNILQSFVLRKLELKLVITSRGRASRQSTQGPSLNTAHYQLIHQWRLMICPYHLLSLPSLPHRMRAQAFI